MTTNITVLHRNEFVLFFRYKNLLYKFALYTDGYTLNQLSAFIPIPGKGYITEDNGLGKHILKKENIRIRTEEKFREKLKRVLEKL